MKKRLDNQRQKQQLFKKNLLLGQIQLMGLENNNEATAASVLQQNRTAGLYDLLIDSSNNSVRGSLFTPPQQ